MEHALFAEIEHQLGRPLTADEARAVEMPACSTPEAFNDWLRHKHRKNLTPLKPGAELCERIRQLQPFHRNEPADHPLRVLVEHTNWSKHRTPSVAAVLLGAVIPDGHVEGLVLSARTNRPLGAGDVLASVKKGVVIPLDIWPDITVQRPHSASWHNLLNELRDLEEWVREVALRRLIAGDSDVQPLRPHLDITVGYSSFDVALKLAGSLTAAARTTKLFQTAITRDGLARTLAALPYGRAHTAAVEHWVAALTDDEVLANFARLAPPQDPELVVQAAREMIDEARAAKVSPLN